MTPQEEKVANNIINHKEKVGTILAKFCAEIAYRAAVHDASKLSKTEFEACANCVDDFSKFGYGTPEYEDLRKRLNPQIIHHNKVARHHPEHFEDGIDGMNLIDILEMLCDWRAAADRVPGDSIKKNLPALQARFKISPQLLKILENTLENFKMY
jgi:hypothetical protein